MFRIIGTYLSLSLLVWRLNASISSTSSLQGKFIKSFLFFGNFTLSGVENAVGGVILSMSSDICCSFNTSTVNEELTFSL